MFPKLKTPQAMCAFLKEAARYFENRPTNGEDKAYWSNVINADRCKEIAEWIEHET